MTQDRVAPPPEAACLHRPYPSSQKGGTLIAGDVLDLVTHEQRLRAPDGYRPAECPTCGHSVMHRHDYRSRRLQIAPGQLSIRIIRHACANARCGAQWQTLPAFVARHLWYNWSLVAEATAAPERRVPRVIASPSSRTVRRWNGRLGSSARRLVQVLATSGAEAFTALVSAVGLDAMRRELVEHARLLLSEVAALVHRLGPGVRLM